jgi:hypothetical protein
MEKLVARKNALLLNIANRKHEIWLLEQEIKPVKQMKSIHFSATRRFSRSVEMLEGIYSSKNRIKTSLKELNAAQVMDKKAISSINRNISDAAKAVKLFSKNPEKVEFSYRFKIEN